MPPGGGCTCDGEDLSPSLAWSAIPQGVGSLALIVDDPGTPAGTFVHWVIYDIPSLLTGLPEGIEKTGTVPGVGVQGQNDFNEVGYGGPCPLRAHSIAIVMPCTPSTGASKAFRRV